MTVGVEQEMQLFKEAVVELWKAKRENLESLALDRNLWDTYPPINGEEALTGLLPGSKNSDIRGSFGKVYLWLQKTAGMQPVIHLKYDFSCNIPEIRIRLGLFSKGEDNKIAFGFRFESPEGVSSSGEGRHHYYHVQMIRGFKKDGAFKYPPPDWLPVKEPALPLPAEDSLSLFFCFSASLYGIDETRRLIAKKAELRSYLEKHPFKPFDSLEWHWQIQSQQKDKVSFHRSPSHPDAEEPSLRKQHPNSTVEAITKKRYDELIKDAQAKKKKR